MPANALATAVAACIASAASSLLTWAMLKRKAYGQGPKLVQRPHPDWKPGQKMPHPFNSDTWVQVDPADTPTANVYALVISAVTPRPIAFISSLSKEGKVNLSPMSYFNAMHQDPPLVAIGISTSGARGGGLKDTSANILETGEFVVNIISEWFVEAANHCAGEYDRGVNEFELSGLTPIPSDKVKPPRVKESAIQMECVLRHHYDIHNKDGKVNGVVIIGEVKLFHIHEGVVGHSPTGKLIVDPLKARPVSRFGGITYGKSPELFDIPRPDKHGNYPPST